MFLLSRIRARCTLLFLNEADARPLIRESHARELLPSAIPTLIG
jgi:hypothetical protein